MTDTQILQKDIDNETQQGRYQVVYLQFKGFYADYKKNEQPPHTLWLGVNLREGQEYIKAHNLNPS